MGKMADALERAEQKRSGRNKSDMFLHLPGRRRWSEWYGFAKPNTTEQLEAISPPPPLNIVKGLSEEIVSYYDRSSIVCEQYRGLRTRLMSANPTQEHRIFGVSSAVPREGKSVTTANLGFCFAEIPDLKVLIVDGDFRQASLARLLNIDQEPGLADMLCGQATYDDVVRPTPLPNLFFVPAGRTRGRSATELFSGRTAKATFARFHREFAYTIVDTPPAATVSDVGIIGQMTSGIIFVVRVSRTPEPIARRAIRHVLNNNVPILGALVIGEDEPSAGYGKQYGYYPYGKRDYDATPPQG